MLAAFVNVYPASRFMLDSYAVNLAHWQAEAESAA